MTTMDESAESPAQHTSPARPYPHQVGGHGQLAMTKTGRLLKPLTKKERTFYHYIHSESLPSDMHWIRNVTPKYYGEAEFPPLTNLDKPYETANSDNPTPTSPSKISRPRPRSPTPTTDSHLQQCNPQCDSHPEQLSGSSSLRWRTVEGDKETTVSPWAAQMDSRWQAAASPARKPRLSITLEDINRAFILPCVMDCKIGTRHYDDDASEEKRRRHIRKANATTSAKCGVRYTGMQSLKRSDDSSSTAGVFESRNKYHGRTLKEPDLVPEATWFFHDGHRVRTECVRQILERISQLRRFHDKQHHFYFYSSSLLLVYEGALPNVAPPRVEVRMIDFAHTVLSNGNRDDGYLLGINYLTRILTEILENEKNGTTRLPPKPSPESSVEQPLYEDFQLTSTAQPEETGKGDQDDSSG